MAGSQVHKSLYITSSAHRQVRDWRVSRNLGTRMPFKALLCENWAFNRHSKRSLFVEARWEDGHLPTGSCPDTDVDDSFHIHNWRGSEVGLGLCCLGWSPVGTFSGCDQSWTGIRTKKIGKIQGFHYQFPEPSKPFWTRLSANFLPGGIVLPQCTRYLRSSSLNTNLLR